MNDAVDWTQWKVLTRALLKRDFRTRTMSVGRAGNRQQSGTGGLLSQAILYGVFGMMMAGLVVLAKDLFFIGIVLCAYVMFMVGTAVLLDHSSAFTAADDYAVLGFRPVTSRTYFAVRLTNVLIYTMAMTSMVAIIPIGALFWKHGLAAGSAGVFALYGSSLTITFLLLLSYASLQRFIGADRMKNVLTAVQMVMSFGLYGGFFFLSRIFTKSFLSGFTLAKTWWLMAWPPAWFASAFDLAAGQRTPVVITATGAAVVALAGLTWALTGSLSSGFTERLGESTVAVRVGTAPRKPAKAGRFFRGGESRAMALLIRSQFRNDQKFKMGVLTIIPLTVLYIFRGVSEHGGSDGRDFTLVGFAVMMFPAMLKMQLTRSDSYRASWIFFTAPVDRSTLIRASKNVVVAMFLLPYLAFVSAALIWATKDVPGSLLHVVVLGCVSHLVLQITVLLAPELPFALPMEKTRSASLFTLMIGIGLVNVVLTVFSRQIFSSPLILAGTVLGLIGASVFVELLTTARIDEQTRKLEFAG